MNNQPNWGKIKQSLNENFIEQNFKQYENSAFSGVDFNKGLEIFRYIVEQKLPKHNESKSLFDALQSYADGQQNKEILEGLVFQYEPFLKKLFQIINIPYHPNPIKPKPQALAWCYNALFDKLNISQSPYRNDFFAPKSRGTIDEPLFPSANFSSGFLTDATLFGKALHSSYHLRNSNIHNDPYIINRDIPEYINDFLHSYLYFIFKFYGELSTAIPDSDLNPSNVLTVKNLASLSGGAYNPQIENEVKRENILETIENKLKELDVLFIEGEDGIGKTTLLHQFLVRRPNNCFANFIDSKDSTTYSNLSILQAFCNQIHFELKQYELAEEADVNNYNDENWLKNYLKSTSNQLTNNTKANQIFHFIIDGIDEISQDRRNEIKEQILAFIPYTKSNIKLILTGKQNKDLLKNNSRYDKFEMFLLLKEDSKHIAGSVLSQAQFEDVNRVCGNNAGKIVFFRDLIKQSDVQVQNIVDNLTNMNGFYTYLWNNHFQSNPVTELMLSIITFQNQKYTAGDIAKILGRREMDETKVIELMHKIPFVRKNARGTYEYIFDDFKTFAEKKLAKYKSKIDQVVIDYLVNHLQSLDSLVLLPEMYKKTGKTDDLLKLLDSEKWNQLLRESEKISVVSRVSDVALQTIQTKNENKYIPTILKYSVLKSALKELSQITVWQYEIATNLVLDEYLDAMNLAELAFLKEDKLKMFASIAKVHVEKGTKVPDTINKKISELYEDIDSSKDFKNIKEAGVEIASLLMYSNPKLAFRLIEDLSGAVTDNDNAFDWALAQISLSAHSNLGKIEEVSQEDIDSKVYSKIRDPRIKEFTNAIFYLSENQTSEQIIEKINQLESTSQKMFLIRNWINKNFKDPNVADVINLGLTLVVDKSDKYVPKSSDYKIFAKPLPHLTNQSKTYELIKKIEQYTASIEANSSTNELVTIKLFIVRALCNFDFEKGEEKLFEIYTEIEQIYDPAIKCTCFAIFLNEATRIGNIEEGKNLDLYLDSARKEIENNIDNILAQTAAHFEIVQNIITNLARLYPGDAIQICKKLNKSIDRDNAFLESFSTYLNQSIEKIDINTIDTFLDSIEDLDIYKMAITEIVHKIVLTENKATGYRFFKFFEKIDSFDDNRAKCLLYVDIISLFEKCGEDYSIVADKMSKTWKELEKSVYKIELGFEIAYRAAFLKDKTIAKTFLQEAKSQKEDKALLLDSPNTTQVFGLTIELIIRVFAGLIVRKFNSSEDLNSIEEIINSLPSESQQINLWSTLILRVIPKLEKGSTWPRTLINSYIIPKLSKIKNKGERINAVSDAIVVLYFADKQLPYLKELPSQKQKDMAISRVCKYLFTKCLPEDECDNNDEGYCIDFETIKNILELTNRMSIDYFIAAQVVNIRKSINSKNTIISSQQKIDIENEFEVIANSKLPDNNNIRHLGYQIFVKANAISIRSKTKWNDWEAILKDIDNIPNLSDRIFMWVSVADLLPQEFTKEKQDLINDAEKNVYKLPSFLDTVGRLTMIFMTLNERNISGVGIKTLFEKFIKVLNKNSHSPFLRENYQSILDVAYATDPTIAKTYINALDNDNARLNTGAYLNNHLNLLEFQSKLENALKGNDNEQHLIEGNPKYFNKIIEKRLARLNAQKFVNDKLIPKDLVYQLKMASEDSIYNSYNAFSYFIERLVIMYENTEEAGKIIRKSFLELLDVCNLIKLLSIRNADKIKSLLDVIAKDQDINTSVEAIRKEIGEEKYQTIVDFLNKEIQPNQLAIVSGIDVSIIRCIAESL